MSFKKLALASGVAASLMASTAYASVIDRPFFQVLGVVVVWGGNADGSAAPVVNDFVLLTPSGTANDLISTDGTTVVTGTLDPVDGTPPSAEDATIASLTDAGFIDAETGFSAFGIDATSDVGSSLVADHNSSFYVASNTGFQIRARVVNVNATQDFADNPATAALDPLGASNITFGMSVNDGGTGTEVTDGGFEFGAAAQLPHDGSPVTGVNPTITHLSDIGTSTDTTVYIANRRTASAVGTLAEQSVRFDNTYQFDADPSTAAAEGYDLSMGVGTLSAEVTYTIFAP